MGQSAIYLSNGSPAGIPAAGDSALIVDPSGVPLILDSSGGRHRIGGGTSMRQIVALSAADVLPAGFGDFWTDYTGEADHGISVSAPAVANAVAGESCGKRRLDTAAGGPRVAECMPYYNQAGINLQLPTMINPKTSAWYVEGRAAIETHGANSMLLPCSIALTTGGTMSVPAGAITGNTFCGLGLVGTVFSGGSVSFLSFIAVSSAALLVQTTTIPWVSTMQSYSLHFDGAGTITARAYTPSGSVQEWTTTNLNQVPVPPAGSNIGFHPNQWLMATDATVTTMLVDYLYGAGPRI
jgi:hypothetical protein